MSDEKHKEYSHEEGLRLLAMTKDTYLDDCPEEYKPTVRAYRSEMFHAWVIKNAEAMLNCISEAVRERDEARDGHSLIGYWRERADKMDAYAVPAREALERVMVGGNHLANVLIGWLGPDFSYKYPPTMDVEQAREAMANDAGSNAHDVWCCWRTTMNARAALSKCGAESNEATKEDR